MSIFLFWYEVLNPRFTEAAYQVQLKTFHKINTNMLIWNRDTVWTEHGQRGKGAAQNKQTEQEWERPQ